MSIEQRPLGRTGAQVSVVGLGTWQLGADWGDVDDAGAGAVLSTALDAGVTLLDTADVYGDGRSEQRIRQALEQRPARPFVATKAAGAPTPSRRSSTRPENLRAWVDRSRRNLGVDTLDLVQLHCPPTAVYSDQRVYDALDALVEEGALAAYGVSVETVAEGLTALEHPGVQSIQVILNVFRRKPLEELLPAAAARAGRRPGPGPAGQRPAQREVRREHHVRRRRPPHLQPQRRGLRRRRDLLRRARSRWASGPRARSRRSGAAPRRPPSRCGGSSTRPASRRSSPAPATPSRCSATSRPRTCRR